MDFGDQETVMEHSTALLECWNGERYLQGCRNFPYPLTGLRLLTTPIQLAISCLFYDISTSFLSDIYGFFNFTGLACFIKKRLTTLLG